MTIKTMLAGIPMGGAKAGVSISVGGYDREELVRLVCNTVGPYIKRRSYFPGTDMGFSEADVDLLYRCAGSKLKFFSGGITVGEACATGIAACLGYMSRGGLCRFQEKTVAIEGFGRIGVPTAKLLSSEGFRIVAISNLAGTLYDPEGLDMAQLFSIPPVSPASIISAYSKTHRSATVLPREAVYYLDSEILIPGARALIIDEEVARKIKSKVLCPISNAPVTVNGEEMLARLERVSVPDIVSNAGGLIASFAQHLGADASQTRAIILEIITHNLDSVFNDLQKGEVPKKIAAAIALKRLREIEKSERIGTLKFLSPWIRTLGLNAISSAFKEYFSMKSE
jgi:glutamate dehydrogenase (NAD(P)+)